MHVATLYPSLQGRCIATPSWVMVGTVAENAEFLAGRVHEIGLCFFETEACLAYGEEDLPRSLTSLDVSWHVHLPSDLPWHKGGDIVAHKALALMDVVAFLGATRAVLHPPVGCADGGATLLAEFIHTWSEAGKNPADILLENIRQNDLVALWSVIGTLGCKVCLDTGHLLAYAQDKLLSLSHFWERVGMMHLCATERLDDGHSGRHVSLAMLTDSEQQRVAGWCQLLPQDAVVMLELFKWADIESSLPLVAEWLAS